MAGPASSIGDATGYTAVGRGLRTVPNTNIGGSAAMRLESAQQLKQQLLRDILVPLIVRASKLRSGAAMAGFKATGGMAGEVTPFGVGARPIDTLPRVQRSIALGVAPHSKGYRLAIRLQRPSLRNSSLVEHVTRRARGEVDMRIVGRIDKRVKKPAVLPWYQRNARPL